MPPGLPEGHGDGLTDKIDGEHPAKLADTALAVPQKESRQKDEQGHMEQVDQPVEPVLHWI